MNGEQQISLRTIPKPGRKREDMEIVAIDIRVYSLAQAMLERL